MSAKLLRRVPRYLEASKPLQRDVSGGHASIPWIGGEAGGKDVSTLSDADLDVLLETLEEFLHSGSENQGVPESHL